MYKPEVKQFFAVEEPSKGVFGIFDDADTLLDAARKTRDKKYEGFDCFLPLPVHGIEDAMGLPRSGIPWITFFAGLFGCVFGFLFMYLIHVHDYPLNFAGKALNAWPAFIPVIFEMTVFFAGFSSVMAFVFLSRLNKVKPKILHPDLTSHKFALFIPTSAPGYKEEEVAGFIKSLGAKEVTILK